MDARKDQLSSRDHQGSQQVRANMDVTRQAMDRTIDALQGRLKPSQLWLDGLNLVRSGSASGAAKLVELAREHPVPAAVIGVGVGMMIREMGKKRNGSGRSLEDVYSSRYGYEPSSPRGPAFEEDGHRTATEKVAAAATSASAAVSAGARTAGAAVADTARGLRDAVKNTVHDAKAAVDEGVDLARGKAGDMVDRSREAMGNVQARGADLKVKARGQVRDAKLGFWLNMEKQPLVMGAAAIALGLVAGLLVPATRKEDQLMGGTRDDLFDRAQEKGREILQKGKQVAETAVENVKAEAKEEGLTPKDIAARVKTIGREAFDMAKSEATL
jgi:hypothetical protein